MYKVEMNTGPKGQVEVRPKGYLPSDPNALMDVAAQLERKGTSMGHGPHREALLRTADSLAQNAIGQSVRREAGR